MSSKSKIESVAHASVQISGLKSLSFRTLGAEVGVKSSSVHYHFPEKSDLGEALLKRFRKDLMKTLSEASEQSTTAYESIMCFSQIFIDQCHEGKICFAGMMAAEVGFLSDANRDSLNALLDEVHAWLCGEFNRAGDELSVDLPSNALASVLFSALEGALLIGRSQGSDEYLRSVNALIDSWFGKVN